MGEACEQPDSGSGNEKRGQPAEPGEFTKRAFLNGRIDLSQAEAVMDLIQSRNKMALKSSVSQLQGSVRQQIEKLRSRILYETAFLEAALDDPEHTVWTDMRKSCTKQWKR